MWLIGQHVDALAVWLAMIQANLRCVVHALIHVDRFLEGHF